MRPMSRGIVACGGLNSLKDFIILLMGGETSLNSSKISSSSDFSGVLGGGLDFDILLVILKSKCSYKLISISANLQYFTYWVIV